MHMIVEWVLEGLFSIVSFTSIVSPRKEYDDYKEGEEVQAKFKGKAYPAKIFKKSVDKDALQNILDERAPKKAAEKDGNGDAGAHVSSCKKRKQNKAAESESFKNGGDDGSCKQRKQNKVGASLVSLEHDNNAGKLERELEKETMMRQVVQESSSSNDKKTKDDQRKNEKELHKDCASKKEYEDLKEEIRRLKRRVRDLEKNKAQSPFRVEPPSPLSPQASLSLPSPTTPSSQTTIPSTPTIPLTPQTSIPTTPTTPTSHFTFPASSDCDAKYNGHTIDELADSISHLDSLYTAVRVLLLQLFPEDYIISHTISGKAANSKTVKKPPYDLRLFGALLKVVKNKFGVSNKEVTEKVHSVQKSISKSKKTK